MSRRPGCVNISDEAVGVGESVLAVARYQVTGRRRVEMPDTSVVTKGSVFFSERLGLDVRAVQFEGREYVVPVKYEVNGVHIGALAVRKSRDKLVSDETRHKVRRASDDR